MPGCHAGGRYTAQIEQREPKRRRQKAGLKIDRNHDRHPFWIHRAAVNHRPDNRDHDVYDLKKVEDKPKHEKNQHDNQEHKPFLIKAAQELLDVMLSTKGNQNQVQHLTADQNGEHHRCHFGRLADNRA